MTDRLLRIWLSMRNPVSARAAGLLVTHFGDPAHIYAAEREEFLACSFLRKEQVDALCDKDLSSAEEILHRCEREHIDVITPSDPRYPARLKRINDPPQVLYVRGQLPDFDRAPAIAIVGTRDCTAYGYGQAKKFAAALAAAGFTVVTGMARGVDGAASRGALNAGKPTAAVLAGGVDRCYPPEHRGLMGDILLSGAVISENPPGTPHAGKLFPMRNRILSGLCAGVLVVEAPMRSGALITAERALDQGREVFVLPGNVSDAHCAGSNRLLRDGGAQLALEPMDIVHALSGLLRQKPDSEHIREIYLRESGGQEPSDVQKPSDVQTKKSPAPVKTDPWEELRLKREKREKEPPRAPEQPQRAKNEPYTPTIAELEARPKPTLADISGDELLVAQVMQQGAKNPDDIIRMSGLSPSRALSALTMLEMDGLVKGSPTEVWLVDR